MCASHLGSTKLTSLDTYPRRLQHIFNVASVFLLQLLIKLKSIHPYSLKVDLICFEVIVSLLFLKIRVYEELLNFLALRLPLFFVVLKPLPLLVDLNRRRRYHLGHLCRSHKWRLTCFGQC